MVSSVPPASPRLPRDPRAWRSREVTSAHLPPHLRQPLVPLPESGPVPLPEVGACDLVTVSVRHGLEAIDILRLRDACGAVVCAARHVGTGAGVGAGAGTGTGTGTEGRAGAGFPAAEEEGEHEEAVAFLVPIGTAEGWPAQAAPGSFCVPGFGRMLFGGAGVRWLVPPSGEGRPPFTDPETLRQALTEAARTLAASDVCRGQERR